MANSFHNPPVVEDFPAPFNSDKFGVVHKSMGPVTCRIRGRRVPGPKNGHSGYWVVETSGTYIPKNLTSPTPSGTPKSRSRSRKRMRSYDYSHCTSRKKKTFRRYTSIENPVFRDRLLKFIAILRWSPHEALDLCLPT